MKKRTTHPMTVAAIAVLAAAMVLCWGGCGRERDRVADPPLPNIADQGSTLAQPTVPSNVMAVYEQLKSVTSPSEAEPIVRALSAEDQAALGELYRVTQIDTVMTEAPAAPPDGWQGSRTVVWTSRLYRAIGRTILGDPMYVYDVTVRWGYDGHAVYSPSASATGRGLSWPWSYVPPSHYRLTGSTGWWAVYEEVQGQFRCALWPPFPSQYPYMQIWMYGNGFSICKVLRIYLWWVI